MSVADQPLAGVELVLEGQQGGSMVNKLVNLEDHTFGGSLEGVVEVRGDEVVVQQVLQEVLDL